MRDREKVRGREKDRKIEESEMRERGRERVSDGERERLRERAIERERERERERGAVHRVSFKKRKFGKRKIEWTIFLGMCVLKGVSRGQTPK